MGILNLAAMAGPPVRRGGSNKPYNEAASAGPYGTPHPSMAPTGTIPAIPGWTSALLGGPPMPLNYNGLLVR